MLNVNGVLNPGLMPQTIDDLRIIAPVRAEIDDQLVGRWNRVAEVWRENFDFRGESVLAPTQPLGPQAHCSASSS